MNVLVFVMIVFMFLFFVFSFEFVINRGIVFVYVGIIVNYKILKLESILLLIFRYFIVL